MEDRAECGRKLYSTVLFIVSGVTALSHCKIEVIILERLDHVKAEEDPTLRRLRDFFADIWRVEVNFTWKL